MYHIHPTTADVDEVCSGMITPSALYITGTQHV